MDGSWLDTWRTVHVIAVILVLVVVAVLMTNVAAIPLAGIRWQIGASPTRNPRDLEKKYGPPGQGMARLAELQASWNPWPVALVGVGGLIVLLWLMYQKPF